MLLSNQTSEALDIIVGQFFNLNRSFDRAVSVMQNKWTMPNASEIVHHNLAHVFPLMADIISGFKDQYNILTFYPETHADNRDYDNLYEMWNTMLGEVIDCYKMIQMGYKIANDNQDLNAMTMLYHVVDYMNVLISQVITLKDKAEAAPEDYNVFDYYISGWGIDGVTIA